MKYLVYLAYLVSLYGIFLSVFSGDVETTAVAETHSPVAVRLLARSPKGGKKKGKKGKKGKANFRPI